MARNSYLGGSTVTGPGARWFIESWEQPTARPRGKRRAQAKGGVADKPIFTAREVALIRSVLADMGRTLPTRIDRLNAALATLVREGIVAADGRPMPAHPFWAEWLARHSGGAPTIAADRERP